MPKHKPPKATPFLPSPWLQNLVLFLPMDEGGGSVAHDVSGQGADGVFNGALTWGNGQSGYDVASFTGGNPTTTYLDCGNVSNPDLSTQAGFTMAAWVFPTAITGNHWIFGRDDSVAGRDYAFGINSTGQLLIQIAGSPLILSVSGLVVNQWQHIAVAAGFFVQFPGHVNGTYAGYINGVFQAALGDWATLRPVSTTAHLNIGRRSFSGFNEGFIGAIDSPQIWTYGLGQSEISAVYSDTWNSVSPVRQAQGPATPAPAAVAKGGYFDMTTPYGIGWYRRRRRRA